ncbi:MAG: hypothetical protein QOF89_1839 [Acidobacteriota bacterium]|jgi:hypothetical protein|nr:hypothetical protein [Acidobacteriota bacterium]
MRIANRTFLPAALVAALLCPLVVQSVEAQSSKPKPPIRAVEVVVRDIATKEDIGTVQPGGSISIPAGSRVRLIMTAMPAGNGRPLYPTTTYSDQSQGGVQITRSNAENSAADLAVGTAKGNRTQAIGFQIQEDWVPANLRTGTINLRIVPGTSSSVGGNDLGGGSYTGGSRAEQVTQMLYRGILMRDPDPGAQGTIDAIANGGYDAAVRAAVGIANSSESRNRIPGQGVSSEDRLAALYQNLLGMSPDRVDRSQYDNDLRRITAGRIADVVSDMVQSERFRSRASLTTGTRY